MPAVSSQQICELTERKYGFIKGWLHREWETLMEIARDRREREKGMTCSGSMRLNFSVGNV
jgi:hypothetical protein